MACELATEVPLNADPRGFKSLIREEICSIQFHADVGAAEQPVSLAGVHVGGLDVLRYAGYGVQWGNRDREDIRSDHADFYVVCVPTSAQLNVNQNGESAQLRPGTFAFVSTSRPFNTSIRSIDGQHAFSALHVRVPGSLLRPRVPNVDDICGLELEVYPGAGRTMRALFEVALNEGAYLSEASGGRFGGVLLDAISDVALPTAAGAARQIGRRPGQRRTVERAKSFIAAHLSDPDLKPAEVAEYCGVSVRYLQATFAAVLSTSVAGLIRETRLQECRSALKSPLLASRSIIEIAGDWGFDDASHFSHAYKKRFGVTPREER